MIRGSPLVISFENFQGTEADFRDAFPGSSTLSLPHYRKYASRVQRARVTELRSGRGVCASLIRSLCRNNSDNDNNVVAQEKKTSFAPREGRARVGRLVKENGNDAKVKSRRCRQAFSENPNYRKVL